MEHENFERELKYLIMDKHSLNPEDVFSFLSLKGYVVVERKLKRKDETYYDDENLTFIKRGDVIRCSKHINNSSVYTHFMFKKNACDPSMPYVSKYEFGSGCFDTIDSFISHLNLFDVANLSPVLGASMVRHITIFEKKMLRIYVTFDDVEYFRESSNLRVSESMLEIEDWTTPNTTENALSRDDSHLLEVNDLLLCSSDFPVYLTKDSKPLRGYLLLKENGLW